jgi:Ca2+-binding EF-hand superfamily protein
MNLDDRVDAILVKLREQFEIKSGYRDEPSQAKLLEKHFRFFDKDGSGTIDYQEFTSAMIRLNFVGVQPELEGLFDRFDEDLSGTISYIEFTNAIFGLDGGLTKATPHIKNGVDRVPESHVPTTTY